MGAVLGACLRSEERAQAPRAMVCASQLTRGGCARSELYQTHAAHTRRHARRRAPGSLPRARSAARRAAADALAVAPRPRRAPPRSRSSARRAPAKAAAARGSGLHWRRRDARWAHSWQLDAARRKRRTAAAALPTVGSVHERRGLLLVRPVTNNCETHGRIAMCKRISCHSTGVSATTHGALCRCVCVCVCMRAQSVRQGCRARASGASLVAAASAASAGP
jgi:hypothetical protein